MGGKKNNKTQAECRKTKLFSIIYLRNKFFLTFRFYEKRDYSVISLKRVCLRIERLSDELTLLSHHLPPRLAEETLDLDGKPQAVAFSQPSGLRGTLYKLHNPEASLSL